MTSKSRWCPNCHREYVRRGMECTVCTYKKHVSAELKSTLLVVGLMALLLTPGVAFVYALFTKLGI